jgi:quercetin dioxygenase-like cupin family protein
MTTPSTRLHDYLPARFSTAAARHWVPASTPGKSSSPLRFLADDRGFVELLRMEPGVVMPLHRHAGEIHAYNLGGTRKLCTGKLIGPGDYVYEPPGNEDWWKIAASMSPDKQIQPRRSYGSSATSGAANALL